MEPHMHFDIVPGFPSLANGGWLFLTLLLAFLAPLYLFVLKPLRRTYHFRQAESYCPSIPLPSLPRNLDKIRTIPSLKKGGMTYRVNLYQLTCNCPSFHHRRRYYPKNDIRRLCRHLRKELQASNAVTYFDELTQRIVEGRVKDLCYTKVSIMDTDVAFGFHPKNNFARIYTRRKSPDDPPKGPFTGPYDKFTYLVSQETWVYGEDPPGSDKIIVCLKATLANYRNQYPDRPEPKAD